MSSRKRKAAICCLIAASILALERRNKRKREIGNEDESKHRRSMMDYSSDCDQEEEEDEEEEEEENYDTYNNSGVTIKVEPGLADEDSINEYPTLKEEVRDPLDIDIDSTTSIKQENNYNYESSAEGGVRIKVEPDYSDDDINDGLSQNHANDSSEEYNQSKKDSSEGCSKSKDVSVDVQAQVKKATTSDIDKKINHSEAVAKNPNETRDECQVFGDYIAGELRNLKSEENRKKLKRIIQKVIIEISESEG